MSGAISIPFAFIAVLSQGHQKRDFALLAFCALWVFAIRLAWKNYQMLEKEKPKFKLSCSKDITGCAVLNENHSLKFFRLLVETDCVNGIENCLGHLIKIEKDGVIIYDHDARELPFAPAESVDSLAKTIFPATPYYLDVLVGYLHHGHIAFATKDHCSPKDIKGEYIFRNIGEYNLTVGVSGKVSSRIIVDRD